MIIVKFAKNGKEYGLPKYENEDEYTREILAVLTGIPLPLLIGADLTDTEFELIEAAGQALRGMPMWAGPVKKHSKYKLKVVK